LLLSIKGEVVKPETVEWIRDELGAKTALWYPDDPRFFNSLVRHMARSYDHVFIASERAICMYREIGCEKVHFLPFACEPMVHERLSPPGEENGNSNLDVVFVGTYARRRGRLIEALEKTGIKVQIYGLIGGISKGAITFTMGFMGLKW